MKIYFFYIHTYIYIINVKRYKNNNHEIKISNRRKRNLHNFYLLTFLAEVVDFMEVFNDVVGFCKIK